MRQARGPGDEAHARSRRGGFDAEGVVDVRLEVEHHMWRGARQVAKFVAMGTAVGFDRDRAPEAMRGAPSLRLASGAPFTSDLTGPDFVALLRAGYRPVSLAMGACVYGLDPRELRAYRGQDAEIGEYTQAFFDARESAMDRLQQDLFNEHRPGAPDAPVGHRRHDRERVDLRRAGRRAASWSSPRSARRSRSCAPRTRAESPAHPRPQMVVPLDG